MPPTHSDEKDISREQELRINRQVAFASGLFQGDVTIRTLLESLTEGVVVMDDAGTILLINDCAEKMFGYPTDDLVGKPYQVLIPQRLRDGRQPHEMQSSPERGIDPAALMPGFLGLRQDGSEFPLEISVSHLDTIKGVFTLVFVNDITGRKKVEEALRFSERRYRALFNDNPTMIFTIDAHGNILSANPSGAGQLGFTVEELEGQPVLNLFHQDDRHAVTRQLRECQKNPSWVHHWQLRKIRKDGAVLWVEEVAQAVYDLSGSLNVLVVCQDITDRKRMEEVVRNCETRFRRLFETATDGILIIDANTGEIVDVNPYLLDVLGCSREEMLGRKLWDLCPPAKDLALSEEAFAELQQKHIRYEDLPLVTHDGTPIAVEFISNVHEIDGTRLIQCNIRDITDRKRAEEEICRLNAHLRERAEELELANKELEAFNFTVAHDLRQPLNLLGTYCQAIMRLCSYQLTEECAGYVQKGYEVTQRMNRTIESLLHFSQVGHVDPRREPIDLDRMAHEVAKELATTDPDRQVEFRIDEGIIAKADANLIRLALDNLLGNAWKYTSEQQRPVIEFGAKEVGGEEIYFVRDNGAGFDMADAAKVFAPFQRLAGAEDRAGFGIGLATVENIVRRHGGRIWAESEPGKGATFYFTIPAAEEGDPCQ